MSLVASLDCLIAACTMREEENQRISLSLPHFAFLVLSIVEGLPFARRYFLLFKVSFLVIELRREASLLLNEGSVLQACLIFIFDPSQQPPRFCALNVLFYFHHFYS